MIQAFIKTATELKYIDRDIRRLHSETLKGYPVLFDLDYFFTPYYPHPTIDPAELHVVGCSVSSAVHCFDLTHVWAPSLVFTLILMKPSTLLGKLINRFDIHQT